MQTTRELANSLHDILRKAESRLKNEDVWKTLAVIGEAIAKAGRKAASSTGRPRLPCAVAFPSVTASLGDLHAQALQQCEDPIRGQAAALDFSERLLALADVTLDLGASARLPCGEHPDALVAAVNQVRRAAESASHACTLSATAIQLAAGLAPWPNTRLLRSLPPLGLNAACGCGGPGGGLPPDAPAPAARPVAPVFDPEILGASLRESEAIVELFRRLLRMLILLLAIMPVVSCSNLCTEGAIRATMLNAGCDAVCNSSFDILWEYCCLEACFLWVTGTDWNGAGTTSHSFGPALGANRDAPATRRAQQVGAAAAAWITAGGPLPPLLRGKTFRPALVAPKSPC